MKSINVQMKNLYTSPCNVKCKKMEKNNGMFMHMRNSNCVMDYQTDNVT